MTNTMMQISQRDNKEYAARRFAQQMLALLQDYIPRGCERDAAKKLFDTAFDGGVELTSMAQRQQYEAFNLQIAALTPRGIFGDMPHDAPIGPDPTRR
jgi:hypothetical protein